jgi:hypothetical protein
MLLSVFRAASCIHDTAPCTILKKWSSVHFQLVHHRPNFQADFDSNFWLLSSFQVFYLKVKGYG